MPSTDRTHRAAQSDAMSLQEVHVAHDRAPTARLAGTTSRSKKPRVRFAVVGLGHIAQVAVLPAFAHVRRTCTLAALVSDDAKKLRKLGRKYGVKDLRKYRDYDELLHSGAIDAVYIALPNDMHHEYTMRAVQAGVHVLCEKPLAVRASEAVDMVRAAKERGVKLMTAYRLHFERTTLRAIELVQSGRIGEPRFFQSSFGMQVEDEANIRLDPRRGGGPVFDLGVYCINAARNLFRAEPIEVIATHASGADARFARVPEMTAVVLRFPGERLATFTCSFGSADISTFTVVGTQGRVDLDPAYDYSQPLEMRLLIGKRARVTRSPKRDQFAPELAHMAQCILADREPEPSGREGLADMRVIDAINQSAAHGKPVTLSPFEADEWPGIAQAQFVPPVSKPREIAAHGPRDE